MNDIQGRPKLKSGKRCDEAEGVVDKIEADPKPHEAFQKLVQHVRRLRIYAVFGVFLAVQALALTWYLLADRVTAIGCQE